MSRIAVPVVSEPVPAVVGTVRVEEEKKCDGDNLMSRFDEV